MDALGVVGSVSWLFELSGSDMSGDISKLTIIS